MVVIWFWPTLFMCAAGRHLAYTVCVTFVCAAGDKFRVCAMGASAYNVCRRRFLHMVCVCACVCVCVCSRRQVQGVCNGGKCIWCVQEETFACGVCMCVCVCAGGDRFRVCAMGASAYGVCWMRLLHMLLTIGVQLFAVHFTPHPFRVKMYPALNAVIEWCAES